jgi:Helix-turn-helix of DDE superfamily endonuclease
MAHSRFQQIMALNRTRFRRRTGVYPETFHYMHDALKHWATTKKKPGRPAALRLDEQLLLSLEFWREYRTYFHLGQDWGVHETTAQRVVERVEDALVSSGRFALPGKRALCDEAQVWTAVLVDVSEVACERPKKSSGVGTAARKSATP